MKFRPCVIVLCGPPLHGKTTIAKDLVGRSNLMIFDVDVVRRELLGLKDGDKDQLRPVEEEKALMIRAYEETVRRAGAAASTGSAVIIPSPFSRAEFKAPLQDLVERRSAEICIRIIFLEVASRDSIRQRIASRLANDPHTVIRSMEQYEWALTLPAPWWPGADVRHVDVDCTPQEAVRRVVKLLGDTVS
jgi:predicted kinase